MRGVSVLMGLCLLGACGTAEVDATGQIPAGGAAGSGPSGGTGGSPDTDAGGGGIGRVGSGEQIVDATADPVVVLDAGWFECSGCLCDGTAAYCTRASGGAPLYPPPPPADAAACPQDGGQTDCKPLPSACNGVASCACVEIPGPHCSCEDAGGGILVSCSVP